MHTNYYGDKSIIDFDLTNTLKSTQPEPDFIPIELPKFDEVQEVMSELDEAEHTLFKYKQMLEHVVRADEITDSITCGKPQHDHMTEHDEEPTLEHCTMDVMSITRKHIKNQIAKFQKYCDDLQAEIDDHEQIERDESMYGTHNEQVRSLFYSTR